MAVTSPSIALLARVNSVEESTYVIARCLEHLGMLPAGLRGLGSHRIRDAIRGISVWAADPDEIRGLCEGDPAVQAGRFEPIVMTWMVPAGQVRFESATVPRSMAEMTGKS